MSVLDTFYLLFKSNAKETGKDVSALDNQIGQLAKKGTKRNQDEEKQLRDLRKLRQQQMQDLKDQKRVVDDTGAAFTNLVEAATKAGAAIFSYGAIKSGIVNAQEFNRSLSIQSRLWGQNANEVAAYAQAVKAAGGSEQGLIGWYDQIFKNNAAVGLNTLPIGQLLGKIHNEMRGMDAKSAQTWAGKYGIDDPGLRDMLRDDNKFKAFVETSKELTRNSEKAGPIAEKFGTSYDNLTGSIKKFWTTIDTYILPALGGLFDALTGFISYLANHDAEAMGFFTAIVAISVGFAASAASIAFGFLGMGAAATAALPALAALAAQLIAIAGLITEDVKGVLAIFNPASGGDSLIAKGAHKVAGWIDSDVKTMYGSDQSGSGSMDFWMSKGYSREQAAGLVANERRESSGNPSARGDGGKGVGLFQWHPDRAAAILKGTNIDVRTAGSDEQLQAAAWELDQMGLSSQLKGINDPASAASFVSRRYERPANGDFEAVTRGRMALQIAGETPFASQGSGGGGNSTNVQIDRIDVNTQATDASGIAGAIDSHLKSQIKSVHAQVNDAVAM